MAMKTLSEIRKVKKDERAALLEQPGVSGVGVGYKYVDGKRTDELCIVVYVTEKKATRQIPKEERIPRTVAGVKTDVVAYTFAPFPWGVQVDQFTPHIDTGTYDPLLGGISIGRCGAVGTCIFVGTLGVVVNDNESGDPMMLSNWHVMAVDNNWNAGDNIAQPSRVDGGNCPADTVGTLTRAVLGGQVDCAVATITDRGHLCQIVDIGEVHGIAEAVMDEAVRKRGRTTELTFGFVDSIDLDVRINYDNPNCNVGGVGQVILTDQIGIRVDPAQSVAFGLGGDSGSVVVNAEDQVIGLYFAGNIEERDPDTGAIIKAEGVFGVANPIQAVLDALDVRLCTPPPKPVFVDEPTTLKFLDDPVTLKFFDEPTTFKFLDDPMTIKFWDEPATLKFLDDGATLKILDDPKSKALDDPGTDPRIDAFKTPQLDKHPAADAIQPPIIPPIRGGGQAPFILATPHHSAAYMGQTREQLQAAVKEMEEALTERRPVIEQMYEQYETGEMSAAEFQRFAALVNEFQVISSQYQQLSASL